MISQNAQGRFDDLYERLIVSGVRSQIALSSDRPTFSKSDLAFLMSVASRLALESDDTEPSSVAMRLKAYEIATRVIDFAGQEEESLHIAARLVLARLGNFPARDLMDRIHPIERPLLPPYLALEAAAREVENTLHIKEDVAVHLTDFQCRLLGALQRNRSVSVSAPTSAGKSFALSLDVVRRFTSQISPTVVYLVPTRALIRQVMYETIEKLNEHGLSDVPVLCVPEPKLTDSGKGVVYVLTQERLHTLLHASNLDPKNKIDILIVDEAQEISEGGRGLVLETVIERTLRTNPGAAVFFSSPLRANPNFLLNLFGRSEGEFFVEHDSPVSQSVISVRPVTGDKAKARIDVMIAESSIMVDEIKLAFEFSGQHLPKIAVAFSREDECSILYADDPGVAESRAEAVAAELSKPPELDNDVKDLIAFVRDHIHPKYRLVDCLERRVGFHYGQMPQIVRARIEELLKKRSLRFVCCTSTLLQGVNLPARNIFIENPKKGRGNPMRAGDFWNLAGRAGRLTKEFHGNVWCVFSKPWQVNPLEGERLEEMSSAFRSTILTHPEKVLDEVKTPDRKSKDKDNIYEQAFGRIFVDYLEDRTTADLMKEISDDKRPILQEINQRCAAFATTITLPRDVFARNAAISPLKLEELAEFLRRQYSLSRWIPEIPKTKHGYANMKTIFGKVNEIFLKTGKEDHVYYCWLASQWIRGESLKKLIADKLKKYDIPDDPKQISKAIRELFEELERTLRFKYVKYLRAYNDVLRSVLEAKGDKEAAASLVPLHLLIEYGAWDKTLISLMSLGISRTSAILLKSILRLANDMDRGQCQSYLNKLRVGSTNLPAICKDEVRRIKRVNRKEEHKPHLQ